MRLYSVAVLISTSDNLVLYALSVVAGSKDEATNIAITDANNKYTDNNGIFVNIASANFYDLADREVEVIPA